MYCYVVGRNLINGQPEQFQVAEGAVFTENYNETLDSGTIILDHLTKKIKIEPFDEVLISNYGDPTQIANRRMCVDTYTCTQVSLNPPLYKYEISLFSETKLLEGVLLPNLAITKRLNAPARSVYYYLDQYLNQYGPKLRSDEWVGAYYNKWTFGSNINDPTDTVAARFGAIDCPELQWNEPTLREVFTDLMMVNDCIPVIGNGVINFIDISQTKSEFTSEQLAGINYVRESRSSADYVSELKMNLVNAANNSTPTGSYETVDDPDMPQDATRVIERIGFRNNDSYLLTTENMELQTTYPIWQLFYCSCIVYKDVSVILNKGLSDMQINQRVEIPIPLKNSSVDYIPEYGEWLTKDVFYGDWFQYSELSTQYRNTCLYYTRGGRNISNFNNKYVQQFLFISQNQYVIELVLQSQEFTDAIDAVGRRLFEESGLADEGWEYNRTELDVPDTGWKDCMFEVAYEPIDECVFRASKSPLPRHVRQVVDNQSTSYINVKRQGLLEYMKANRLGNKMILINGRYSGQESTIPTLAQTFDGKIVFQKQISVFYDHIDVNYLAAENYVLKDYFTGVKSKLRTWPVLTGKEAFIRAESKKFYVNSRIPSISNNAQIIPSYPDIQTYLEKFKYCAVVFETSGGQMPTDRYYGHSGDSNHPVHGTFSTNAILCEVSKHVVGRSVVFTIRMVDNACDGNYISDWFGPVPNQVNTYRTEQKSIAYADNNGEITGGTIYFYDEINNYWYNAAEGWPDGIAAMKALRPLVHIGYTEGHLIDAHMVAKIPFTLQKDNKEIFQMSIQFEINEDANDIFLGYKE